MKTYNTGDRLLKQEVAEFIQQSGAQLSDTALQGLLKKGGTFEIVEITLANVATDAEQELLYVGITDKVTRRLKEHKIEGGWRTAIHRLELLLPEGARFDCEKVEQSLIDQLKPKHNIVSWDYKKKQVPLENLQFTSFLVDELLENEPTGVQVYKVEELVEETFYNFFRRVVPMSDYQLKKYIVILQKGGFVFKVDENGQYEFSRLECFALECRVFAEERVEKEGIVDKKEIHDYIFAYVKKNTLKREFGKNRERKGSYCTPGHGRLYRSAEFEKTLGLKRTTLSKYFKALEAEGYTFERNHLGKRELFKKDLIATKKMIDLTRGEGVAVKRAAQLVVGGNAK